ncbi:MAG: glycosyltransferase family 2 protein, partial [Bacteroidota bacterium]
VEEEESFHFFPFKQRRGKPPVINDLVAKAISSKGASKKHLILLTDANVMMHPKVLFRLARHFKDPGIALVDAHMQHIGMASEGISQAENQYLSAEVKLKHWESQAWRKMMGPFGGCYMIRTDYFKPVPANFLVDDFYIAMKVFEQKGQAINDLEAHCYEDVSHEIKEEYRRKKRISAGNFQNLLTFKHLWWPPFQLTNWIFFSHKILRWLGPFFLLGMMLGMGILATSNNLLMDLMFLLLVVGIFGVPILDWLLEKLGLNLYIFRGLRYFMLMNLALLEGFFKYLKGIKSNVWQPTKRN